MSNQPTNSDRVSELVRAHSIENLAEGDPKYTVMVYGNCPACKIGTLENEYGKKAIVIGILFGYIAARFYRRRRCPMCGALFDHKKQPIKIDDDEEEKTAKK